MNILIIEDEDDFVTEIRRAVSLNYANVDFRVACNKTSALQQLKDFFFDLIFLDLRIPTDENTLDSSPENGREVLDFSVSSSPGTPVFILTGSSAEDFLPDMLQMANRVDVWGTGKQLPLISLQKKHRLNDLGENTAPYITGCAGIFEVEVNTDDQLTVQESRLIKIFCRSVGGFLCRTRKLSGGLSGASVFSLVITDVNGSKVHDAVAKIGSNGDITTEVDCYDRYISRLDGSATPRKIATFNHGAKDLSGVFYSLAGSSDNDIFALINGDSVNVIRKLRTSLNRWNSAANQRRLLVQDIRRCFISDEAFSVAKLKIRHDWIDAFENTHLQANWGCVHGDLHGLNILVTDEGNPVLIDYGDVKEGACSQDPITLELSTLFHTKGPFKGKNWPNEATTLKWGTAGFIDEECPAPDFYNACREWAEAVAAGRRERAAVGYGYLVRQLKYEDCDVNLANSLLAGAKQLFDNA